MTKQFYFIWSAITVLFYTFFEYFLYIDSEGFLTYRSGLNTVAYSGQFVHWLPQVVILAWLFYNVISKSSLLTRTIKRLSLITAIAVFLNVLLPILVFITYPVGLFIAPIIKIVSEILPWVVAALIFTTNTNKEVNN
jgi:hypothetical protein